MTYEIVRATEKQRLWRRNGGYTKEMFDQDFCILVNLFKLSKTERVDQDIDIYFKIKFFRQLGKIPFINPIPYMCMTEGVTLAMKDVVDLSISYFIQ